MNDDRNDAFEMQNGGIAFVKMLSTVLTFK